MSLVALVLLSLLVSPALSLPIGIGPALDYGYDYLNGFSGYDYAADYAYPGYPRTIDYAKENFIRGSPYGATEVGTRDEVSVRPSSLRTPYSRFYSSYYPYSYLRGINRYPIDYGYDYLSGYYGYDNVADYTNPGYPPTVDYAKENFVRGSPLGTTEVGTRDEVTLRPNGLRAPYSRFYSSYYPYSYLRGTGRYPFDYKFPLRGSFPFGPPLTRSSYLGRLTDDALYF